MSSPLFKSRVKLSDYDYRQDIRHRLFLAKLSLFEIDLLREIVDNSLTFSLQDIADTMEVPLDDLLPALEKFKEVGLLTRNDELIVVDKERRKSFEAQLDKFEEDFKPDISYFLSSLNKVPKHVLLEWYSIPRMADNIHESLIEKYLKTPKIYHRYLEEIDLEEELLTKIKERLAASRLQELDIEELQAEFSLSDEALEEVILQLEFNLIGYVSYQKKEGRWTGLLRPFDEWREFREYALRFSPSSIQETSQIRGASVENFPSIRRMNSILKSAMQIPLSIKEGKLDLHALAGWIPPQGGPLGIYDPASFPLRALEKILQLQLGLHNGGVLHITEEGKTWLARSEKEQALILYRHPANALSKAKENPDVYNDYAIRQAEKSLHSVADAGWVLYKDFIRAFTTPLRPEQQVTLQRQGRKWGYLLPTYTDEERDMVFSTIFERLYQVGMVDAGYLGEEPCFTVTSFGQLAI